MPEGGALAGERYRVIVSTDLNFAKADRDDSQSLVHLLLYADLFDLEGLISSPPAGGRTADILRVIDLYGEDYPTLRTYSDEYPSPDYLRSITKQGAVEPCASPTACTDPDAIESISSEGWTREPTEGSQWIIRQAHKPDPRPLYVLVWGAITDVAQAVHDDPSIKDKIRVYFIAGWNRRQDQAAFDYLATHHPDLWLIRANTTFRGWYMGGNWVFDLGNCSFVEYHVEGHGALGDFFATLKGGCFKMGDTPSVAYLLRGDPSDPTSEHWGGRFVPHPEGRPNWWVDDPDRTWQINGYPGARTISQYREEYLRNWQARMDRAAVPKGH